MIVKLWDKLRVLFTLEMGEEVVFGATLKRSLELVAWAVAFGIIFFNITTGFPLAGLARELGFGELLYAVMLAMPVLGGTAQIVASLVLEKTRHRKAMFLWSGLLNRLPWLFIAFLPFLIPSRSLLFVLLVSLLTLGSLGGAFLNVSFMSWVGDLVPLEIRGRFFGHRTMIATASSLISGLIVGKLLDAIPGVSGFGWVFALASGAGIFELWFFWHTYDPPMTTGGINGSPLFMLKQVLCCRPFVKFLFFIVFWNFSVNVASPFFNLYMLKHLHMDFFDIALYVQVISNIATVFFVRVWGKMTDRFGNKPITTLSTFVAVFLPVIWCLTTPRNWIMVIPVIQTLAGIFWPGIDLTTNNLLLKLSPVENRSLYVATFNLFLGVFGTALAYLTGGYLLEKVVPVLYTFCGWPEINYFFVFLLSSVLRLVACLFLLPRIEERGAQSLREVQKIMLQKKGDRPANVETRQFGQTDREE